MTLEDLRLKPLPWSEAASVFVALDTHTKLKAIKMQTPSLRRLPSQRYRDGSLMPEQTSRASLLCLSPKCHALRDEDTQIYLNTGGLQGCDSKCRAVGGVLTPQD